MSKAEPLGPRLAQAIAAGGPIPVAHYMAVANAHYYATRDPLGADGDFTTAPEISQMFGEIVGLWLADLWLRAGRPVCAYVELGPGRGTLPADALRAMATVGLRPDVHLVETSPVLRTLQRERVGSASWHDGLDSLPKDKPLLAIANEFFDALPIHQIVRASDGWRQRVVAYQDRCFVTGAGNTVPDAVVPEHLRGEGEGAVIETSPACVNALRDLAQRIGAQGGVAAIIDYGYDGPQAGETLQALSRHKFADPFEEPGERDLTAHIDFATLSAMAELCGTVVQGPVSQGQWLNRLGLAERTTALAERTPDRAGAFQAEYQRLTGDDAMGRLFRVMAVRAPDWPAAEGFGGSA